MKTRMYCIALSIVCMLSACSDTGKGAKNLIWLILGLGGRTNAVTPVNAVGPTASTMLRTLDFTPANDNAVFVSKAGNDTTGTGVMELPFLTINKAITACDATHQAVVILDSGTYEEKGFEMTGNFRKLAAAIGQAPVVRPLVNGAFMVAGDLIVSESTYNDANSGFVKLGRFSNDTYVIAYSENGGRFVIVDKNGSILVTEKIFESAALYYKAVSVLSNGNFFISWYNQFVIYDSDGEIVKDKASFTVIGDRNESVTLSNDNVVLAVQDAGGIIKFKIFDMDGTEVVAEKTVSEKSTTGMNLFSMARFSNDNFVICYASSSKGYFKIFDSSGNVVVTETEFDSDTSASVLTTRMDVFDNDNFVIAYTLNNNGYFSLWNSAGENIVPKNNFFTNAGGGGQHDVRTVCSNIFAITMTRASDGRGVYFVYDTEGNPVLDDIVFHDGSTLGINTEINNDGNALIVYRDVSDSVGNLTVRNLFKGPAIRVSAESLTNGILFDGDGSRAFTSLFDCTAPMSIQWCDLAGADSVGAGFVGQSLRTTAGLIIQNSRFYNNGAGIYAQTGLATITGSQFYNNTDGYALRINGAAASAGDITIDHCDFFNNGGGVRLEANNGANEVVKNSIFHDNTGDAVNADVNVTVAHSVVTGTVTNVINGEDYASSDPLYVNEGVPGPDDIDLNLQSLFAGYPTDSPAIGLGDDGRNAGAHNVEY